MKGTHLTVISMLNQKIIDRHTPPILFGIISVNGMQMSQFIDSQSELYPPEE